MGRIDQESAHEHLSRQVSLPLWWNLRNGSSDSHCDLLYERNLTIFLWLSRADPPRSADSPIPVQWRTLRRIRPMRGDYCGWTKSCTTWCRISYIHGRVRFGCLSFWFPGKGHSSRVACPAARPHPSPRKMSLDETNLLANGIWLWFKNRHPLWEPQMEPRTKTCGSLAASFRPIPI